VRELNGAVVMDVSFRNFGEPRTVRYVIVETIRGARIHEVKGKGYTLSELMK
jgi:hypothetical protein